MMWDPLADVTPEQRGLLDRFEQELAHVNRQVNLVAPSTIAGFQTTHVIHSLAIARRGFPAGATVVDFGAGGGLPAVPLAIRFPNVGFVAIDSSRKKTEAIRLFARRLGLQNLDIWNGRAEAWPGRARYAVSRATAPLVTLLEWFVRVREAQSDVPEDCWPQGVLTLKGGDLSQEIAACNRAYPGVSVHRYPLDAWLGAAFQGKELLHARSEKPDLTGTSSRG